MRALATMLWLALAFFQIAATVAGLKVWLGLHWILAVIIATVISGWPLIGTVLGVFGAHAGWGWSWIAAISLFFGPFLIVLLITYFSRD